jgi:uncharacterized protein (DUF736 family)
MADYDNTNRGVLFKAKEKKSENSPAYTGNINVGGKEYKISAWVKESKNTGDKFFSISVSDPNDAGGYQPKQSAPQKKDTGVSMLDDDIIPF